MGNRRPIGEYFDAARAEPGISEEEVRRLVAEGAAGRRVGRTMGKRGAKRMIVGGGAAIAIAAAIFFTHRPAGDGGRGDRPAGEGLRQPAAAPISTTKPSSTLSPAPSLAQASTAAAIGDRAGARAERANTRALHAGTARHHFDNRNETATTIQLKENQMLSSKTVRALTTAAVAIVGSAGMSAQTTHIPNHGANANDQKPAQVMMRMMGTEMGQTAYDYWMPKLNVYKGRIDRMLAPADLDELNRLRVRFNVIAGEFFRSKEDARAELMEREKEELLGIYNSVRELADRYRPQGDALGETVSEDIASFFPAVADRIDNFASTHNNEMSIPENARAVNQMREHMMQVSEMIHQGPAKIALKMAYPVGIEPLLMLYDGTDLKMLLNQAAQFIHGKEGGILSSPAIAGYMLPEGTLLKQSAPNPASGSVRIGYTLNEASGATLLRLFNAKGDLVGTYDQGAQGAGEHEATVDLSSLPAGTYLYHLSIQTAKGEQVFSKTLQVVR